MTDQRGSHLLSSAERSALLAKMRGSATAAGPKFEGTRGAGRWDTTFETLPGYQTMKTQSAAAAMVGLASPFYRLHEKRAGASAMIEGHECVNFASYDYLGLNAHPAISEAVAEAAAEWGTSVSASRLTAGERPVHRALEQALAEVYGSEAAVTFVSGHATNVTAISALVGPKDLVLHDSLIHNSVVVGALLSSAQRRIYPHNDLDALEQILATLRPQYERCLIITEGLFSMDGDGPDLARLVEIKERWGAWLMVDEAHSLGVLGATGRGIFEHANVDPHRVDIWMGTLSKTLVGCGGYIAGSIDLIEFLKFHAAGMVYSVGLPVPIAVASLKALELMRAEPERVARLAANGQRFLSRALAAGLDVGTSWGLAISPVVVGDSLRTVVLADRLFKQGINAFPIIPPGVPEKSARLRFFLSAAHSTEEIDRAVEVVATELARLLEEGISVTSLASMFR